MKISGKKKSKFITIYNTFTEKEKNEFRKFLEYNIYDSSRNYNHILDSINLQKTEVPNINGWKSNSTRWNRLSELHQLAEKFLTLKSVERKNFVNKYLLMTEYDNRNLLSPFEQNYKSLMKEISQVPIINYDYSVIYQLDMLYLSHLRATADSKNFVKKLTESGDRKLAIFMIEILEHLLELMRTRKYKILHSKTLSEVIFGSFDFDKILFDLEGRSNQSNKLFHILKFLNQIYLSLNDFNDRSHYEEAKRIFFRDLKSISKDKREDFYMYMLNYNIELVNRSDQGASEELFFLMNTKLKEGLVSSFKINNFPVNPFREYIIVALSLRKFQWINNFIKSYAQFLPEDIREDYVFSAKAMLLFEKKDFASCKDMLDKIKKKNPFSFADVSVLKLKALYELKNFDECHDELKRFREYLRKERNVENQLIIYSREFCKAYFLLLKLNQRPVKEILNGLQFHLSNKTLIGKKWIIQKMDGIKLEI